MNRKNDKFYEEICEKYYKDVYEFCLHLTKWDVKFKDISEECTQETFIEAKKQIDKLRSHPNVKGWLYQTAKNLVNNSVRKYHTKNKYIYPINEKLAYSNTTIEDELDKIYEDGIDIDNLRTEVLKQLKDKDCKFYEDYFIKKLTVQEMAEKYNISASAIYTRIHRLKIKIQKIAKKCISDKLNHSLK